MRTLVLAGLVVLSLSSCSSYQYLTLNSSQLSKNDKKEFTWENDTIRLVYNFHGHGGPIHVTVYNKTSQPLFIQWKKSAIIRDGHSTVLFDRRVLVDGTATTTGYSIGGRHSGSYIVGTSDISAHFDLPEGTDFLPPHTDFSKGLLAVQGSGVGDAGNYAHAESIKLIANDGMTSKARRVTWEEPGSPLQFKLYLTFALGSSNGQEFTLEHSFYANELIQTKDDPSMYSNYGSDGDKLYVKQSPQQASGM